MEASERWRALRHRAGTLRQPPGGVQRPAVSCSSHSGSEGCVCCLLAGQRSPPATSEEPHTRLHVPPGTNLLFIIYCSCVGYNLFYLSINGTSPIFYKSYHSVYFSRLILISKK